MRATRQLPRPPYSEARMAQVYLSMKPGIEFQRAMVRPLLTDLPLAEWARIGIAAVEAIRNILWRRTRYVRCRGRQAQAWSAKSTTLVARGIERKRQSFMQAKLPLIHRTI